jgi:flagellar basal-body rod protein FlgF
MDRLIYTVLTGLGARGRSQAVTANNLANAETTGFRREIIAAEGRYLQSDAATTRAQAGAPSLATPRHAGKIIPTGRPLDVALAGDAWLALQGPLVNGRPTEHYSRRGDLSLTTTGLLQNGDGRLVLNQNGTAVTVPAGARLSIGDDGTLSARIGEDETPLGKLKLVAGKSLDGLDKASGGHFTSETPLPVDPTARLTTGTLEASNVETAGALAELVEQSRGFEVNARLLGLAKDIDERTARLMQFDAQ